mmetsp:Transcript_18295/g.54608  ORF Transcript_18295/g.54608 Transcript_18295/m.54608 type:complete len:96 (+) Transcript_18295:393-680(+)
MNTDPYIFCLALGSYRNAFSCAILFIATDFFGNSCMTVIHSGRQCCYLLCHQGLLEELLQLRHFLSADRFLWKVLHDRCSLLPLMLLPATPPSAP